LKCYLWRNYVKYIINYKSAFAGHFWLSTISEKINLFKSCSADFWKFIFIDSFNLHNFVLNNKESFNFTYEEFDDYGENITKKNQDKIKFEMMDWNGRKYDDVISLLRYFVDYYCLRTTPKDICTDEYFSFNVINSNDSKDLDVSVCEKKCKIWMGVNSNNKICSNISCEDRI
jgi:hypothetical protein